jgi:hypothetical protein
MVAVNCDDVPSVQRSRLLNTLSDILPPTPLSLVAFLLALVVRAFVVKLRGANSFAPRLR